MFFWKTFADAGDRRIGNRLVQEKDEFLLRTPLFREVSTVDLQRVEDNGFTLLEPFTIGCQNAVGDFATSFDKWVPSKTDRKVRAIVIRRPQQDGFWWSFCCFRQSLSVLKTDVRLFKKKKLKYFKW